VLKAQLNNFSPFGLSYKKDPGASGAGVFCCGFKVKYNRGSRLRGSDSVMGSTGRYTAKDPSGAAGVFSNQAIMELRAKTASALRCLDLGKNSFAHFLGANDLAAVLSDIS
jgi:hypothetical protein